MMPQFDTFSFFSQIFWVFTSFTVFYLVMCFYILPALAITLKIRKHKLQGSNNNTNDNNLLLPATMTKNGSTILFLQDVDTEFNWLDSWIEESLIVNNSDNNLIVDNSNYASTVISSVLTSFYKLNLFLSLQKVTIMKFAN